MKSFNLIRGVIAKVARISGGMALFAMYSCLVVTIFILGTRYYLLPNIDNYKVLVGKGLTNAVGQPVTIGRIKGEWLGYRPQLTLYDVRVAENNGHTALELERVDAVLSINSLFSATFAFHSLEISQPVLEVRRDIKGQLWVAGAQVGEYSLDASKNLKNWVLRQRQILVQDATINWTDEYRQRPTAEIKKASLRVDNYSGVHQISVTGEPPPQLAESILLRASFNTKQGGHSLAEDGIVFIELKSSRINRIINTYYPRMMNSIKVNQGFGDLKFWGKFGATDIRELTVDFSLYDVGLESGASENEFMLKRLKGVVNWSTGPNGMLIKGKNIVFDNESTLSESLINFKFLRAKVGEIVNYKVELGTFELGSILPLVTRLGINEKLPQAVMNNQISGKAFNTVIVWTFEKGDYNISKFRSYFKDLAVDATDKKISFYGADGSVNMNKDGGSILLDTSDLSVVNNPTMIDRLILEELKAKIGWNWNQNDLTVSIRSGSFKTADMTGTFSGGYSDSKKTFGIEVNMDNFSATNLWKYIPKKAPRASDWLKKSVRAGTVQDGRLMWTGSSNKLRSRRFFSLDDVTMTASLSQVKLKFSQRWPQIDRLGGYVGLSDRKISMVATSGSINDIDIADSVAKVHKLGTKKEYLILAGRGSGNSADFHKLLFNSPIGDKVVGVAKNIKADGLGHVAFEYRHPFKKGLPKKLSGDYHSTGDHWGFKKLGLNLENFAHKFYFDHKGIRTGKGSATLLGKKIEYITKRTRDGQVFVNLEGGVDLDHIKFDRNGLEALLSGTASWAGTLDLSNKFPQLTIGSDLVGINSRLPPPLDKASERGIETNLVVKWLSLNEIILNIEIKDLVFSQLSKSGEMFSGGVGVGSDVKMTRKGVKMSKRGVGLTIDLDNFDLDAWGKLLLPKQNLIEKSDSANQAGKFEFTDLVLRVNSLKWRGRRFNNIDLSAQKDDNAWRAILSARQGNGELEWGGPFQNKFVGRFERLDVPAKSLTDQSSIKIDQSTNLPAIDLVAREFSFEGKSLGALELVADPSSDSWDLNLLQVTNADGQITVNGKAVIGDTPITQLMVNIRASDIGKFLTRLGYAKGVDGGTGSLTGEVSWEGLPHKINHSTLNGSINIQGNDGQFTKLEPGAAKLLGILSLQALPRRLVLDFSDIFSSGFNFENISSDFMISDGVAKTNNFAMLGPAARVKMLGEIDLATETQRLEVSIFPQLSTAAAVAGAAVVNPAVGVATYIIQKFFGDPVDKIAAKRYLVTGKWNDPEVKSLLNQDLELSPQDN